MTTLIFVPIHNENGSSEGLGYEGANDQANGTSYQFVTVQIGNECRSVCGRRIPFI